MRSLNVYCYLAITLFSALLLTGNANAQVSGGPVVACSAITSTLPTLRSEGLTEVVGDIVMACTGGPQLSPGQASPQVNITISLTAQVTSRLLNGSVSEALLLSDEPNSGLPSPVPGFGSAEPFTLCSTPLTGCQAWAQQVTGTDGNLYEVAVNAPSAAATAANAAPNVYQGVVSGNQVTFLGVPVLPPGTSGSRIFRITNIRLANPGVAGPVQASILTSNPTVLPLANPTPIVGYVEPSLIAVSSPTELGACNSATLEQAAIVSYSEAFASAFRTRVDPTISGQASGQSSSLVQNVPGTIYNAESNFTMAIPGSAPAGLADFGTRFKAVFRSVPVGARLFVSLTNVTVDPATGLATGQATQPAANDTAHSFAQLMTGESTAFLVAMPGAQTPGTNINVVEITPAPGGTATAVWEVVNGQRAAIDTFQFGVFVTYPANPSAAGAGTVNLSYAPTSTVPIASASATVPRFVDTSSTAPAINVGACGALTLNVNPDPAVYGQPVTLTATAPSGSSGPVSFFDEPALLIGGPVTFNGNKAQTVVSLPVGTHALYATFPNSSSNHLPLVVQKAFTTTVLTASPDRLTLSATVTAVSPGAGTPTGTVQFLNSSNQVIGSALLSPAQGGSTTSLNFLAQRGFTAVYAGDANFVASSSVALNLSPAPGGFSCSVNTSNTPTLRSESITEELGDLVFACTSGTALTPHQPIPQINITVALPSPVTSRLLNGNVSEALLLIDEPNSGLSAPVPGFGPGEGFTLCATPLSGCAAWAQQATGTDGMIYEVTVNSPTAAAMPANAAPNVYQGVVNGNQVTFYGVPMLPPGANGTRVYRITNLRTNAAVLTGSGSLPVQALIFPSDWSHLPITNSTQILGFAQASLSASATAPSQLLACNSQTLKQATILSYSEQFASAYKTRVDPTVLGQPSGQSAALVQNIPGTIFNGESYFTLAIPGSVPAGLADFGTRFKAIFKNVPAGVRLFVSLTNVTTDPTTGLATGQASSSSGSFAQLVTGETSPFSTPSPTAQVPGMNINIVEITPPPGASSATAVWEMVNTSPTALENPQFAVFLSYAASPLAAGSATVNLNYAPTSTVSVASPSAMIPRFIDTSSPLAAMNITSCQAPSTLTLSAAPNPAVYGQAVTLTATATAGATGSVSFVLDPASPLGGPVALSGGVAKFTSSAFPAGTDSVAATYSGDLNFLGSVSNHVTLTVQKASTTTVITSSSNSQSVTATITVNAPGSGAPTGTVQFWNGSTLVGSVAVVPGQGSSLASLSVSAATGLVAVYSGDSNFNSSTSAPLPPPSSGSLDCSVSTANTPILRFEGLTEAVGDIVIVCFGGASAAAGQPVPQLNVTVSLPVPVTSRLLKDDISEALLLIDEPNSGLPAAVPGFGSAQAFTLCSTPLTGCAAWAQQVAGTGGITYEVAVNSPNASATPGNAAPNVYQGVVSGNQVMFLGVPVLAPGNNGARVLRITNVRLDASRITIKTGAAPVQAAVVSSNPKDLPISNPMPVVAFTAPANLATSTATPARLAACHSETIEQAAILTYTEPFASAFKTRVDPIISGQPSGQSAALVQDASGADYFSESDFTLAVPGNAPAGLANFGTRLKAVFRNVPKGVRLFVSLITVTVDPNTGLATGQTPNSSLSFAELVRSETGPFSVPTPHTRTSGTNIELVEITPSGENRSATAVWEVVNTRPNAIEALQFGVFVSYGGGRSGRGTANVDLSYAPTNITTEDGASIVIPRFHAAPRHPVPLLSSCGNGASERD